MGFLACHVKTHAVSTEVKRVGTAPQALFRPKQTAVEGKEKKEGMLGGIPHDFQVKAKSKNRVVDLLLGRVSGLSNS